MDLIRNCLKYILEIKFKVFPKQFEGIISPHE